MYWLYAITVSVTIVICIEFSMSNANIITIILSRFQIRNSLCFASINESMTACVNNASLSRSCKSLADRTVTGPVYPLTVLLRLPRYDFNDSIFLTYGKTSSHFHPSIF
eukprot:755912_1